MVAWIMNFSTPEFPSGREVMVVANDITFKAGSFSVAEDDLYHQCLKEARRRGIPFIYLSANSGARIGLAEELIPLYNVAWKDADDYSKGFSYLYFTREQYESFPESLKASVITSQVEAANNEVRYKIDSIIGQEDGIGVENLKGSGLIAGETSAAYKDIFTISLVTCRSVGIGAYLVRLGQRVVQVNRHPIILTGFEALNKLLGKKVYKSNLELGGVEIMYENGVSHLSVQHDYDGILSILKWLAFVPKKRGEKLSKLIPLNDPITRPIGYKVTKTVADIRSMLQGTDTNVDGENIWESGFFDRNSFVETMAGWAKTVIVGRARLGGIPVGVIAVETTSVERIIPADPADPNSSEQCIPEAKHVWHPNSAYKTAQAIRDFNHGEHLPLMIFANWRGFSGGKKDMYQEVLKFGSMIVDALRDYQQPIMVYIPPYGELRGGSWVVLDSSINPDKIEMYADEKARSGILEPEAIVGIKYRNPAISRTIERLDTRYEKLCKERDEESDPVLKKRASERAIARQQQVLPAFKEVAIHFADLHDTPGRMKAKGVIRQVIKWREARTYFYNRLSRRMEEEDIIQSTLKSHHEISRNQCLNHLRHLFLEAHAGRSFEADDAFVRDFYESNQAIIRAGMQQLSFSVCEGELDALLKKHPNLLTKRVYKHFQQAEGSLLSEMYKSKN
jgi:acetyl-CoA carboxylase/biotin carboxylase 1